VRTHRVATFVEPFERGAERALDDDYPGLGQALSIEQRMDRAHGGTLAPTARERWAQA